MRLYLFEKHIVIKELAKQAMISATELVMANSKTERFSPNEEFRLDKQYGIKANPKEEQDQDTAIINTLTKQTLLLTSSEMFEELL